MEQNLEDIARTKRFHGEIEAYTQLGSTTVSRWPRKHRIHPKLYPRVQLEKA